MLRLYVCRPRYTDILLLKTCDTLLSIGYKTTSRQDIETFAPDVSFCHPSVFR